MQPTNINCPAPNSLIACEKSLKAKNQKIRAVTISKEPLELFKILKFEGLVTSGGEAKALIADGQVLVNGIIETRKRKKIVSGDIVTFGQDSIRLQLK